MIDFMAITYNHYALDTFLHSNKLEIQNQVEALLQYCQRHISLFHFTNPKMNVIYLQA
jgi:hypothetical protein